VSTQWEWVKGIFQAALELPPAERPAYLDQACAGEPGLRGEVESLLAAHEEAGHFLESGLVVPLAFRPELFAPGALAGKMTGAYRLVAEIGRGGMGVVYRAVRADGQFEKEVAVKLVRPDLEIGLNQERLLHEQRVLAALNHPHIAGLLDAGVTGEGLSYLIMEHVPGEPVDVYCNRAGLDEKGRLALFRDICLAVHHAHQHLVIHRDIKPGNILVTTDGTPKLLDFGIAKLFYPEGRPAGEKATTTLQAMTLGYASPEQIRNEPLTTASDIYSLGVVLYRLLTGRSPYRVKEDSLGQMVVAICEQEPERPSVAARRGPEISGDVPEPNRDGLAVAPARPESRWARTLRGDVDNIILRAMQKEPSRRYDSAKALADDIERYLKGEAVQAHRASLLFRFGKTVRRHRTAAAITSLALLLGLVAGARWLQESRTAAEQVRLAQVFGAEVERMEWTMRVAHLLPLHDIRKEKSMVRQRMSWIRDQLKRLGGAGAGFGHYALGRGHYSLAEYEQARQELTLAWQAGDRRPEVANVLGIVLSGRYMQEKSRVDLMSNPESRQARQKVIEAEFRDHAFEYLRQGKSVFTSPDYIRGWIARLDGRYEDSIRLAKSAAAELPWLFEAPLLEGDAWMDIGLQRRNRGDLDGEAGAYSKAESAYLQAERIAPSFARCHGRLCYLAKLRMLRKLYDTGEDLSQEWQAAMHEGRLACQVDPEDGESYGHMADACLLLADSALQRGQDPTTALADAIATARAGLAYQQEEPNLLAAIGRANATQGFYQSGRGLDPRPALGTAMEYYRRGASAESGNLLIIIVMGNTARYLAEYQMTHGEDPQPALREASSMFRQAISLVPGSADYYNNLGIIHQDLGNYRMAHGQEALASCQEAVRCHREAIRLNPNHPYAANNLGNDYQQLALLSMATGRDPAEYFQATEGAFREAIRITPKNAIPYANLVYFYRFRAEHDRRLGRNPDRNLAPGQENFEKCRTFNPGLAENYIYLAGLHLILAESSLDARAPLDPQDSNRGHPLIVQVATARKLLEQATDLDATSAEAHQLAGRASLLEARWRIATRKPAGGLLTQAERELELALHTNPEDPSIWCDRAEVCRWKARHSLQLSPANRPLSQSAVEQGLAAVTRALALNSVKADALFSRGALQLLQADCAATPIEAEVARTSARESFTQSLRLNRWLSRQVEPMLAELSRPSNRTAATTN